MTKRPIAVDLFCGAGGFSLGVEDAGFDVVAAVDNDPICCAVHERNFPLCKTLCRDLAKMSPDELVPKDGGRIDLLFGGPPCQGFSSIGKRRPDDPRNSLIHHFARMVVALKPRAFIMENVSGLAFDSNREAFEDLVGQLAAAGYNVPGVPKILNARDFGVPQDRNRLFLVGCLGNVQLMEPEKSNHVTTAFEALCDLPDVDEVEALRNSDSALVELATPSSYGAEMRGLSHRPVGRYGYDSRLLTCSKRTSHLESIRERFAKAEQGKVEPISRFFKLHPLKPCHTLRAGTGPEHGSFTAPRPIHYAHRRCITVREMARLHSYPDWFRFNVDISVGARQVGNSVPPRMGKAVASTIMKEILCYDGVLSDRPAVAVGSDALLDLSWDAAAKMFGYDGHKPQRTRVTS